MQYMHRNRLLPARLCCWFALLTSSSTRRGRCVRHVDAALPHFPPTYDTQQSTIAMPCNCSGFMDMTGDVGRFGVLDFDWSNGKRIWANSHPMNAEELLVEQAKLRKGAVCPEECPYPAGCPDDGEAGHSCPRARTWVYRNLVKALPWFASVRAKLEDPAYSGFFLQFDPNDNRSYHVPTCDANYDPPKCSALYHDQEQTPGHPEGDGSCIDAPCDCGSVPCGEYLFDHRNGTMLRDWLVHEYLLGEGSGLGNPNVDGFFIDDVWSQGGPSETDGYSVADMGLTPQDVADIAAGWSANMEAAKAAILNAGGFAWQMFDVNQATNAGPVFGREQCTSYLRSVACRPDSPLQRQSMFYGFTDKSANNEYLMQDLAAFLLIRGPYAWLGYSWMGCNGNPRGGGPGPGAYRFPPELDGDYGEPLGTCRETAAGKSEVFIREWSRATVTLDCKNWEATIERRQQQQQTTAYDYTADMDQSISRQATRREKD